MPARRRQALVLEQSRSEDQLEVGGQQARLAESHAGAPLLAALAAGLSAEVHVLAPLSEQAVAELVRRGLGTDVTSLFARACHEMTGGVPFLVQELVRAIAEGASSQPRQPLPEWRASPHVRSRSR